ncbi:MAG: hypothetical protein ACFFCM_21165 [Promethearchaeota archaeon]
MSSSSNDNSLTKKEKEKFVNEMMKVAIKAKKSSKEELSAQADKKIRRFELFQELFYFITIILALILTYIFLTSSF